MTSQFHFDVIVKDQFGQSNKDYRIDLTDYTIIEDIINKIATDFEYTTDNIELTLHNGYNRYLNLSLSDKEKSLQEVGWKCDTTDNLIINSALANQLGRKAESKKMSIDVQDSSEDNLILGASASPTIGEIPSSEEVMYPKYSMQSNVRPVIVEAPCNYVGLVNQAMTCYLNSLLQALYMTPEFRNALYNWEFDGQNETRSIPYQLQKLFLNLQTSPKSAVETTDLTTSFGWQGSDAWHQHDIQELCRVMFDALEQKFKDTKQANLINDLYEGKMLDYVKCLDCGTEKSREDTFLDIPLPVRPFGSVAYNSVEEALRAFVQPETLEGNNQYKCDKCDKKCDAHKGLKFTKFPYLLTLHLKRFDFDYNAMHRIKLNDKVVFPEILNLNSFVAPNRSETEDDRVKCDDCSTADSGSADDESCQGTDVSSTVNGHDDNCADSDEGIDVSSGINHSENDAKGPYVYELFSIMIHSGSATGGHYYAYIKDFDKNLWFCFNDQSVSGITEDDIRKTYGGGPQRYYSGAYGSSTNAYMLMYRQIDKDRNCRVISGEAFPAHIQKLLHEMRQKEEEDRINREKENDMLKLSVNCYVPNNNMLQVVKIALFNDSTLAEAAELAYDRLKLDGIVALEDCRIVVYNKKQDCIDYNFDSQIIQFCNLTSQSNMRMNLMHIDWMLEIKEPGTEFPSYKRGGINMKVYPINLDTEEVEEPCQVRVDVDETVKELKMDLSLMLNIDVNQIQVVMEMYSNEPKYLSNDDDVISFVANCTDYKLYVASALDDDPAKEFNQSKLQKVIERFGYIISINVFIPETDISTLEMLSIPSLDLNQNLDGGNGTISPSSRVSPQPGSVGLSNDGFGDQSNSEDSSLSDSDRTLIGEAPGEFIGMPSSTLNSPADQHMASPVDPAEDTYNYEVMGNPLEAMNWEESEVQKVSNTNYYFNVISGQLDASGGDSTKYVGSCKILVDKRMTLERFKKHLELIVGVPMDYFKIIKQYPNSDDEWSSLSDTLRSAKDGERLLIKLGRILRKNELNCKVFHLKPNCKDANSFLFEHIIAKNQTVSSVKKEILHQAKKQHLLDIPYAKCRLREKNWKKPRKVYFDDQKFSDDITIISNFEMYLQELKDVDTVSSTSQTVLFLRQWCPATLTLKDVEEIVLDSSTMEDFKIKLSEMHDGEIPVENLDLVCVKAAFPCDIHLLEINGLEWNQSVTHLTQWPMQADDGSMFFYRDNREELMELSETMRKELEQNENTRLGRPSSKSNYYSPGKERALKIYLDTSPSKSEDNCID